MKNPYPGKRLRADGDKPHRFVDRVCVDCGIKHASVWFEHEGQRYGYNTAVLVCEPEEQSQRREP